MDWYAPRRALRGSSFHCCEENDADPQTLLRPTRRASAHLHLDVTPRAAQVHRFQCFQASLFFSPEERPRQINGLPSGIALYARPQNLASPEPFDRPYAACSHRRFLPRNRDGARFILDSRGLVGRGVWPQVQTASKYHGGSANHEGGITVAQRSSLADRMTGAGSLHHI